MREDLRNTVLGICNSVNILNHYARKYGRIISAVCSYAQGMWIRAGDRMLVLCEDGHSFPTGYTYIVEAPIKLSDTLYINVLKVKEWKDTLILLGE
jgi:hypothetical protein